MARGTREKSKERLKRLKKGYPKRDPKTGKVYVTRKPTRGRTKAEKQRDQDTAAMKDKAYQKRRLRKDL